MKWNTEQLELGLSQQRNASFRFRHRSQRRLQRASWWFDQMRRAVDSAEDWQANDREMRPIDFQNESEPERGEEENTNHEVSDFYL
ncbi:hypothetical protein N8843_07190 [Verrucomicrobia bacterium]|nr:hypothetical protein [Verrucomicrobiota bacterium]